jgi:TM2 domain-containing membrane protein YozV
MSQCLVGVAVLHHLWGIASALDAFRAPAFTWPDAAPRSQGWYPENTGQPFPLSDVLQGQPLTDAAVSAESPRDVSFLLQDSLRSPRWSNVPFSAQLVQTQNDPVPSALSQASVYPVITPAAPSRVDALNTLLEVNARLRQDDQWLKLHVENAQLLRERAQLSHQLEYELSAPANVTKSKVTLAALEAFFITSFFGCDRCYMGLPCTGVLKGLSCGGFFIWVLIDFVVVAINVFQKKDYIDSLGFSANFDTSNGEINTAVWITIAGIVLHLLMNLCAGHHSWQRVKGKGAGADAAQQPLQQQGGV